MSSRRQVRELALQTMYQYDARGEADREQIDLSLRDAPYDARVREEAGTLADEAWRHRDTADELVRELSPDWPTHRQPIVDRNLIRLGCYEIATGRAPSAVAINEAIELAKRYGSEKSPAFINGLLDRIDKRLRELAREIEATAPPSSGDAPASGGDAPAGGDATADAQDPPAPVTDPWLADALKDRRTGE